MVRSAAKNFEDVAIVTRVADYPDLIEEMKGAHGAALTRATRWRLAKQAFALTAAYDSAIANTLEQIAEAPAARCASRARPYFSSFHIAHQSSTGPGAALRRKPASARRALCRRHPAAASQARRNCRAKSSASTTSSIWTHAGSWRRSLRKPAVIIVKHTNPCGAATGATILDAYQKALACDPVSAFGGVIGINREVDGAAAEEIAKLFVEAIAAPGFSPEARERFAAKKNLRLVEVRTAEPRPVVKNVSGGLLLQDADTGRVTESEIKVVTWRPPSAEELRSLLFAWRICKHVKSNAIVYARDGQTLGVGAGQMSRVDAAKFGAMKAVLPLKGCVAASDAFFPFPDGLEAVAQAGATAVIQPGGSVRDDEVIAAADKLGLAMVFTGIRHFRH